MRNLCSTMVIAFTLLLALPAPTRAQDKKSDDNAPLLTAIGGLVGSSTYFTFAFIGVTADGFGKETYDAEQTKKLAGEAIAVMNLNASQLRDIKKARLLNQNDAESLEEFIALLTEVADYARTLQDFVDNKDKAHAEKFEQQRQMTWSRLKKVLDIKD